MTLNAFEISGVMTEPFSQKWGILLKLEYLITSGIYSVQAKDYMAGSELSNLVRPTIDYLQGLCFPSGNFPSSLSNNTDRLVQWCHGAPGAVFLFAQAYKVWQEICTVPCLTSQWTWNDDDNSC